MQYQYPYQNVQTADPSKDKYAIMGLVAGVINLGAWLLPICGLPLALVGIGLGIAGLSSNQRGMAIAAIVLSGFGLLAAACNAAFGVFLALSQ